MIVRAALVKDRTLGREPECTLWQLYGTTAVMRVLARGPWRIMDCEEG